MQDGLQEARNHFRDNISSRAGSDHQTPSPTPGNDPRSIACSRQHARRSVIFTPALQVHRYPPAVWGDDEEVDAERVRVVPTAEELHLQKELQAQKLQLQQQQELVLQQEVERHAAQQRQQIEEQCRQQQLLAQTLARQAAAFNQGLGGLPIRTPDSREQLTPPQDTSASVSRSSSSARSMDPFDAPETKKISIGPSVREGACRVGGLLSCTSIGVMLPSEAMQRQEEERKRTLEEVRALEEAAREKYRSPSAGLSNTGPSKLRKEPQSGDEDSGKENGKKGKSGALFGRPFDRRRDEHEHEGSSDSIDISRGVEMHSSEESGRSSNHTDNSGGPQIPPRKGATAATAAAAANTPPPSLHTMSLRQRDKEQQALYQQQYLTRSPASPPEAQSLLQLSPVSSGQGLFALGGASMTLSPTSHGHRPRPGSLLIGGNTSGDGPSSDPELSVIRIFKGKRLQTEERSESVLLNSSTTSEELVKQAIRRYRLPAGEDATDYYLTAKRLEGWSVVLHPDEKPLGILRAFTDDSAVKFYLNRRSESASDESATVEGDIALVRETKAKTREVEVQLRETAVEQKEEDVSRREDEARRLEKARQALESVHQVETSATMREAVVQQKEVEAVRREADLKKREAEVQYREAEARRKDEEVSKREKQAHFEKVLHLFEAEAYSEMPEVSTNMAKAETQ